jgi:hypothetical protein
LDGTRKASVAQVVLDAAFPQDKVEELSNSIGPALLNYGTIGLGLWTEGEDSFGIEVIPPWELLPLPIEVSSPTEVRGVIRLRWVPREWIDNLQLTKGKRKRKKNGSDEQDMMWGDMPRGIDSHGEGILAASTNGGGFYIKTETMGFGGHGKQKKDETTTKLTQLVEVWTETSDGYLAEYAVYEGITQLSELYRHDHTSEKYHMPIRVVRDTTVASFWGRSFIDQLIPMNNEIEYALSSLFQAVSDFDLYGVMLWPSNLGTPQEAIRGQDGIKKIVYENDYTCPEMKPFNIEPAKMTGPQNQAIQIAVGLMDKLANQPTEMQQGRAPGRVDSASGLAFLNETSGIPLAPTAKSIALGVGGIYRAMLRILKDKWNDQKVVRVSQLDDSLAGIVLDPDEGSISLDKNAIPYPDEITITVASRVPISKEQQKVELKEALTAQRITLEEYTFEVRKKGLDLPVGMELEWQNYRRAMIENIILFNDGKTPGEIKVSDRDLHRVHENVLSTFMARPEFFTASVEVRDAFVEHYEEHRVGGGGMPEEIPYAEDLMGEGTGLEGVGGVPQM